MKPVEFQKAKVVLLGDSGVGKSTLAARLASDTFEFMESTHGATVRSLPVGTGEILNQTEIILWDLAGQANYNFVHQLFLDDARIAILVVDASDDDFDTTLSHWESLLGSHQWDMKLLVAARCDRRQNLGHLNKLAGTYGFTGFFYTSSKTGQGIKELRNALRNGIQWQEIPR